MLGLITGTGYADLDGLRHLEPIVVDTPFGGASVHRGRWIGGHEVLFMARHGLDQSIAAHLINYRANIWAMQQAGATAVLATAVSGGLADGMRPGDLAVIDDFLDFTAGRATTYFDVEGNVEHTDMSNPYTPELRSMIVEAAESSRVAIIDGATYAATSGPRFETKAEIAMLKQFGVDLVGMTGCPEVILANEIELPYASIGIVSNLASGLGARRLSLDETRKVLSDAQWPLELVIGAVIERYG